MKRILSLKKKPSNTTETQQLELKIDRFPEKDRNFSKGGRSFYFFDFDDNLAILPTPIYVFHKTDQHQLKLSSDEFAQVSTSLGCFGPYKDYYVDFCDLRGSFRNFRDHRLSLKGRILGEQQSFVKDVQQALRVSEALWKGPSWSCFYHAVFNQRPISMITARGHRSETLKQGIRVMVEHGYLPCEPNYLSIFPVSHPKVRVRLGGGESEYSVPHLKRAAIRASVETAFQTYGFSPFHRFGMSDDDPKNLKFIYDEMVELKRSYPRNSFFVISTHKGQLRKREVFLDHFTDQLIESEKQLDLFDNTSPLESS